MAKSSNANLQVNLSQIEAKIESIHNRIETTRISFGGNVTTTTGTPPQPTYTVGDIKPLRNNSVYNEALDKIVETAQRAVDAEARRSELETIESLKAKREAMEEEMKALAIELSELKELIRSMQQKVEILMEHEPILETREA